MIAFKEFETLEELNHFVDKEECMVISVNTFNKPIYTKIDETITAWSHGNIWYSIWYETKKQLTA